MTVSAAAMLAAGCTIETAEAPRLFTLLPSETAVLSAMEEHGVPGMAIAVIEDCELSRTKHYGLADKAAGRAVSDDTLFEAASMSKPVLAYIVMRLADEGRIDLDEPIAETIDDSRISDTASFEKLTPRMILTHHSGLPNWAGNPYTPDVVVPLDFLAEPGTTQTYSGEAIQLLQRWTEAKTGESLQALFDTYLGEAMASSAFAGEMPQGSEPALGYPVRPPAEGEAGTPASFVPQAEAAAGLLTTVSDYARFIGKLCDGSDLSSASLAAMTTIQKETALPEDAEENGVERTGFSLGLPVEVVRGRTIVFHAGNNGNFQSYFHLDRLRREATLYMTNDDDGLKAISDVYGLYEAQE
jgi:CubicO group peptidase (beta-lactamase class C family)